MNCLLCSHVADEFHGAAFKCAHCGFVFKNPLNFLSAEEDVTRYSLHNNNSEDPGYQKFLNKLLIPLENFLPEKFSSLDFGCGPGPTLSGLLKNKGGTVFNYDPIFFNDKSVLQSRYNVVTATEVVEHFKTPDLDWDLLVSLVLPGGLLGIMTQFLNEDIDYDKWWYKNDPTHIGFYNEKSVSYLASKYQLEIIYNDKISVVLFRKKI
jgi:hypothetical protein